ncbi:MAG: hypothetical protein GF333_06760 [Candidatus Omnitrophica bacterium]|nr:hypothetical protein [Candidatus Omnitrophota bacterium]
MKKHGSGTRKRKIPSPDLLRRILLWKKVALILSAVSLFLTGMVIITRRDLDTPAARHRISPETPYAKKIHRLMAPLEYNGLARLMQPDVSLSLSFRPPAWTLTNIHTFDQDGNVMLPEGKYGVCGELAAYMHRHIAPLFGEQYKIEYVWVNESGYFLSPESSHVVLRITDTSKSRRNVYILDPSFHRYGPLSEFEDYRFLGSSRVLPQIASRSPSQTFRVNTTTPLLITRDTLVQLAVSTEQGKFDKDHFAIALFATRRHRYAGKNLLVFHYRKGRIAIEENAELARALFGRKKYPAIREKIRRMFYRTFTTPPASPAPNPAP